MSRNLKIIIIVAAAVLGVGLVVWGVFRFFPSGETPVDPAGNSNTANTNVALPATNTGAVNTNVPLQVDDAGDPLPTAVEVDDQAAVLRLARIFAERYGTFSNRNNFENITNLEPFMSADLKQKQAKFIDKNQNSGIEEDFYGITTTVASMELTHYVESDTAIAFLQSRRVETKSDQDPVVFTQNVELTFVREDDSWKVNSLEWK